MGENALPWRTTFLKLCDEGWGGSGWITQFAGMSDEPQQARAGEGESHDPQAPANKQEKLSFRFLYGSCELLHMSALWHYTQLLLLVLVIVFPGLCSHVKIAVDISTPQKRKVPKKSQSSHSS